MTKREQRNATKLGTLHPEFLPVAELLIRRMEMLGHRPLITQARRTWEEQDALYARGRSASGAVVTNARGGESYHNYGLAIDPVDLGAFGDPDEFEPGDYAATDYRSWPQVGLGLGLAWGSSWVRPDLPHVEWHPGLGPHDAPLLGPMSDGGVLPEHFFRDRGANA